MKGILNINKPSGMTSSDVIVKIRKILQEKTVGHMGTLDPQGEGVLLVGVGKGTRLFDYFLQKDKVYQAEFTFSTETDTLDGEGATIKSGGRIPTQEEIVGVLPGLCGDCLQEPPLYSAKNVNGKRAYDLARAGVEFTLKKSLVKIFSIKLLEKKSEKAYLFEIHCSGGTYIRSICRDLAYSLGTFAIMTSIRRIRTGNFRVQDSVTLAELSNLGETAIISVEDALKEMPEINLPDEFYDKLSNGVKIPYTTQPEKFKLYCKNEFFGIASTDNGFIKIVTNLRG